MIVRICILLAISAASANFLVHDRETAEHQHRENSRSVKLDEEARRTNLRFQMYLKSLQAMNDLKSS